MLKDITIGQYIYGTSPLHRMAPCTKIILTLIYAVVILMLKTTAAYAVYTVFTAVIIFISTVPIKMLLKGLKPLTMIFVFSCICNLLTVQGSILISIGIIKITYEGIIASVQLGIRLLLLIMGTSLLTLTTPPLQLASGIEKLLSPLCRFKVPVSEIAMMMTIAIRFIPTIGEEAQLIIKAQKSRGADMENGNIIKRAKAMVPVIIPLLTGVFRRADELACAMDARCYNSGRRTKMKETHMSKIDFLAIIIFILFTAAALII